MTRNFAFAFFGLAAIIFVTGCATPTTTTTTTTRTERQQSAMYAR
ncbi:hypothetical protein BH20VER2_BH20VER2_15430 [soil metagenome]